MTKPKFFSRIHWLAFWSAYVAVQALYVFTLAPSVTLEDSGELITAVVHFGVPHPPGYPTWTFLTWLFIKLFPFGNLAWRANLCSSLFGALACGVIALVTSYLAEKLCKSERLRKNLPEVMPINLLVYCSGLIGGLSLGFVESLWFQSVITEVYSINAFFFALVLLFMLRWLYEPDRLLWGFLTFLAYGVGITNHQTLTLFAPALLIFVGLVNWRLLRDLLPYVLMAGCTVAFCTGSLMASIVTAGLYLIYIGMMVHTFRGDFTPPRIFLLGLAFLLPASAGYFVAECLNDWSSISTFPNKVPPNWALFVLVFILAFQLAISFSGNIRAVLPCIVTLGVAGSLAPGNSYAEYTVMASILAAGIQIWLMVRGPDGGMRRSKILPAAVCILLALASGFLAAVCLADPGQSPAAQIIRLAQLHPHTAGTTLLVVCGVLLAVILTVQVAVAVWGESAGWNGRRALVLILGGLMGVSSYAYMPIASSTNPPMNWAYTSTLGGFVHSVTRGQYSGIAETRQGKNVREKMATFIRQIQFYYSTIAENYTVPISLLAIFALIGIFEYGVEEKKYSVMLLTGWLFLSLLLTWLVNTTFEEQTLFINRVFYSTSHMIFSVWLGLGVVVLIALVNHIRVIQSWLLAFLFLGVLSLLAAGFQSPFLIYPVVLGAMFAYVIFLWIGMRPDKELHSGVKRYRGVIFAVLGGLLLLFLVSLPVIGWAPVVFAGAGLLAVMATVYLHGSRKAANKAAPPNPFRMAASLSILVIPVLILLKNCFPTGNRPWTSEERGHDYGWMYGYDMLKDVERNAVIYGGTDPGRFVPTFMIFVESFAKPSERYYKGRDFDRRDLYIITQNALADSTYMQYIRDHYATSRPTNYNAFERWLGRDKMYPPKPLFIPDQPQYDEIFMKTCESLVGQPGSGIIHYVDESGRTRMGAEGVFGIFAINGAVARAIFEANKESHAFYVEESFPLAWMYPYLEPHGLIMKLNKEPLAAIPPEVVKKDFDYWNKYVARLLSDPKFEDDIVAKRSFSKLRSSIGGLYLWRNMQKEAEIALLQSLLLFGGSPEGCARLVELYMKQERYDEAAIVCAGWVAHDPENSSARELLQSIGVLGQMAANRVPLTLQFQANPANKDVYLELAATLAQMQRHDELDTIVRRYLANKNLEPVALERTVNLYFNFRQMPRLVPILNEEGKKRPADYQLWYNLAVAQALNNEPAESVKSLGRAVRLNPNLKGYSLRDPRLDNIKTNAGFRELMR